MKTNRTSKSTRVILATALATSFVTPSPTRADNLFVANGANNTIEEFPITGGAGTDAGCHHVPW